MAGLWRQSELSLYSIHDLYDVNLVIDVLEENRWRAADAARQKK